MVFEKVGGTPISKVVWLSGFVVVCCFMTWDFNWENCPAESFEMNSSRDEIWSLGIFTVVTDPTDSDEKLFCFDRPGWYIFWDFRKN